VTEWISTKEAAEYTGYCEAHLRYLLRKGRVDGRKFGRDWFTTKEALQEYIATNPRPGPKPKDKEGIEKRGCQRKPDSFVRMNRRVMAQFGPVLALRPSFPWFFGVLVTPFRAKEPLLAHSLAL